MVRVGVPSAVMTMSLAMMVAAMGSPPLKVTFSEDELRAYFPKKDTTVGDVKRVVFEALDLRQKALDRQKARAEQEKAVKKAAPGKAR